MTWAWPRPVHRTSASGACPDKPVHETILRYGRSPVGKNYYDADRTQADCERGDPSKPSRSRSSRDSGTSTWRTGTWARRNCWNMPSSAGKATSPAAARSSSAPASSPGVRPRTSSSCATRPPTPTCIGAPSISRSREAHFDRLYSKMMAFWQGHDVYVQDCFVGADPEYGMPIRVVSQLAWHNLFARQLFIRPDPEQDRRSRAAVFHSLRAGFPGQPGRGRHQLGNLHRDQFQEARGADLRHQLRRGDEEIGLHDLNYLLPERGVFPMHCSANMGAAGDVALFFGLSGTGKTTLSADPERRLIGDDEHGWSDNGVFNFEGGCYAKCIRLSAGERAADLERDPLRHGAGERGDGFGDAPAGFQFRRGHREHARRLSAEVHRQRGDSQRGRASEPRHLPDGRCVRRAAADFEAHAGAGDVSLSERLHRQGGGHRARSGQGAAGHLQRLFRRAVPAASGGGVRVAAGRETAAPRRAGAGW